MLPRRAFVIAFLLVVALGSIASTTTARTEPRELLQAYEKFREVRRDLRTGISTWKKQGHLAEAAHDEKLAYSEALIDRVHRAYTDGVLPRELYLRLLEQRHRLDEIAAMEFRARRALNQRMKVNARKSMVLSRLPLFSLFRRGWVYTPESAEKALKNNSEVQGALEDYAELQTEVEEVLEAASPEGEQPCEDAERKSLLAYINGLNKKWADHWCTPQRWSGCGARALDEANGLRSAVSNARTTAQCAWVLQMGGGKDGCMMAHVGDGGAAQLHTCMVNCNLYVPYPK